MVFIENLDGFEMIHTNRKGGFHKKQQETAAVFVCLLKVLR